MDRTSSRENTSVIPAIGLAVVAAERTDTRKDLPNHLGHEKRLELCIYLDTSHTSPDTRMPSESASYTRVFIQARWVSIKLRPDVPTQCGVTRREYKRPRPIADATRGRPGFAGNLCTSPHMHRAMFPKRVVHGISSRKKSHQGWRIQLRWCVLSTCSSKLWDGRSIAVVEGWKNAPETLPATSDLQAGLASRGQTYCRYISSVFNVYCSGL